MSRRSGIVGFPSVLVCILFAAGVALAAVSLPDKLKEIPLYPGSKIQQAMDMDKNSMAGLEVNAKGEDVFEFYQKGTSGKRLEGFLPDAAGQRLPAAMQEGRGHASRGHTQRR